MLALLGWTLPDNCLDRALAILFKVLVVNSKSTKLSALGKEAKAHFLFCTAL